MPARRKALPAADPLHKPPRPPRTCSICGETYSRRNLTEEWGTRNPGHRAGWGKTIIKVCMKCRSTVQSQRLLNLAQIRIVDGKTKRGQA